MKNPIYPCLWFESNAKEAAIFYSNLFKNSTITSENQLVFTIEMESQKFMLLNGGTQFKINPSISFFVVCETEQEIDIVWNTMLVGGSVLMPLDKYEWSTKYGWIQDKFGVNWQLSYGKLADVGQKFTPVLMFTGNNNGKAENAIRFYTSVFPESSLVGILKYKNGEEDFVGNIKHAQFKLGQHGFMCMDSSYAHAFGFNEAISFVVECKTQKEIDFFWEKLSAVPEAEKCGWLKDKYGISWQIVPSILSKLMSDPEKHDRVLQALLKMKKFEIEKLLTA